MSLISRIEISNYLTEGLNASRRIVDWRPMISAVTLRLDSKSALLNLTNGGGKTSMADLVLYLLSRDARLLNKIRDKCSPKDRGFTHARVEFRDTSDDSFVAPGLLEPDPLNVSGQTYVAGVVLYDKAEEQPIFYLYSGTLEDSPCYEVKDGMITLVPDARFVEKTKALRGCNWNKHPTKSAWEDAVSLHISTDVLRRNVKYQCEGSDDKNAQFLSFKPRGGETYGEAFFRAVVAPDLLTNILSSWAEEGEQSIEDTLYLSLSQIVKTDDEIEKKDNILKKRENQLHSLQPLLELGGIAEAQLDTNPASHRLRGLDHEGRRLKKRFASIRDEGELLEREGKLLRDQITARSENRASWEEFQQNTAVLPEAIRTAPLDGKRWLEERQDQLRRQNNTNLVLHTQLVDKWKIYVELVNQAGLEGVAGLRRRHNELIETKAAMGGQERELALKTKTIAQQVQDATKERETAQARKYQLDVDISEFGRLQTGYNRFRSVFGAALPRDVDPEGDLRKARTAHDKLKEEVEKIRTDVAEKTAMQSSAARFSDVFGQVDPRTYNPIEEERKWHDCESQAQQSAARLLEKVEAIENFEALFPGEVPGQWISRADQRREELFVAIRILEEELVHAGNELDAIGRMSVVDNDHYDAAWVALRNAAIPCERLAEVLIHDGQNSVAKRAAISAMSGLLPAPVFETREALLRAAELLAGLDIAIPLISADELIAALTAGTQLAGDVYLAGFVAGPYSRQARILLEPAYAESESKRLKDLMKGYESQISAHKAESLSIRIDSDNYTLAMRARDGLRENALTLYKSYSETIEQARCHIEGLKVQTTESALAILKSAMRSSRCTWSAANSSIAAAISSSPSPTADQKELWRCSRRTQGRNLTSRKKCHRSSESWRYHSNQCTRCQYWRQSDVSAKGNGCALTRSRSASARKQASYRLR